MPVPLRDPSPYSTALVPRGVLCPYPAVVAPLRVPSSHPAFLSLPGILFPFSDWLFAGCPALRSSALHPLGPRSSDSDSVPLLSALSLCCPLRSGAQLSPCCPGSSRGPFPAPQPSRRLLRSPPSLPPSWSLSGSRRHSQHCQSRSRNSAPSCPPRPHYAQGPHAGAHAVSTLRPQLSPQTRCHHRGAGAAAAASTAASSLPHLFPSRAPVRCSLTDRRVAGCRIRLHAASARGLLVALHSPHRTPRPAPHRPSRGHRRCCPRCGSCQGWPIAPDCAERAPPHRLNPPAPCP